MRKELPLKDTLIFMLMYFLNSSGIRLNRIRFHALDLDEVKGIRVSSRVVFALVKYALVLFQFASMYPAAASKESSRIFSLK